MSGKEVLGYRAAAASITGRTWWALDILAELGFRYDSSVFPFHGRHGVAGVPTGPHWIDTSPGRSIYEVPLTVVNLLGLRLPCCGGGYLRHFPWAYTAATMRILESRGRSAVVYLHPYELDATPPPDVIEVGLTPSERVRFRNLTHLQYRNRASTETKLRRLVAGRHFGSITDVFDIRQRITERGRFGGALEASD